MWIVCIDDVLGRYTSHDYWKWLAGTALGLIIGLGCAYYATGHWRRRRRRCLMMMMRLDPQRQRLVVLTGCDTGLGYSLSVHSVNRGLSVVAGVLRPDGPGALDLAARGVTVLPLDVTDEESVKKFADELRRILGEDDRLELHALVNNAGVMVFGEFEWQLAEQLRHQLEVNLLGAMSVTRRILPLLRRRRRAGGRIVNVTSHCALAPLPGLSIYGASKAALQAWSESLRVEIAKYGVDVVLFIPGGFTRESNLMARQKDHFDEMRAGMDEEARLFYGEYFERYARYLSAMSGDNGLRLLENSRVYEAFDGALLDERPRAIYKCESWRYAFYHCLFRILPTTMRDWLVERFVQMPDWRGPGSGTKTPVTSTTATE